MPDQDSPDDKKAYARTRDQIEQTISSKAAKMRRRIEALEDKKRRQKLGPQQSRNSAGFSNFMDKQAPKPFSFWECLIGDFFNDLNREINNFRRRKIIRLHKEYMQDQITFTCLSDQLFFANKMFDKELMRGDLGLKFRVLQDILSELESKLKAVDNKRLANSITGAEFAERKIMQSREAVRRIAERRKKAIDQLAARPFWSVPELKGSISYHPKFGLAEQTILQRELEAKKAFDTILDMINSMTAIDVKSIATDQLKQSCGEFQCCLNVVNELRKEFALTESQVQESLRLKQEEAQLWEERMKLALTRGEEPLVQLTQSRRDVLLKSHHELEQVLADYRSKDVEYVNAVEKLEAAIVAILGRLYFAPNKTE